jgi:N-acetylglucosamine malate deacetylase 1
MLEAVMKVVVLCAHPDDETLGCGGWIARLGAEGHAISVVFTTDGVRHPPISTDSGPDSYAALAELGVPADRVHYLGLPTQRSDGMVLRDVTPRVEPLVQGADLLIVPYEHDLNVDHQFAHQLGLIAGRPIGRQVRLVAMEIVSATEYSSQPFQPNFYVDVSATIERKVAALGKYTKQVLPYPHPRSPESVRIKAQQRGLEVSYHYAEAFRVIRWFA